MAAYRAPSSGVASLPGARLLTVEETATRIGISRTGVYDLLREGALGSVKIGRRRRIPDTEVDHYIKALCGSDAPARYDESAASATSRGTLGEAL
jgi:excisionase family DNA binding protein